MLPRRPVWQKESRRYLTERAKESANQDDAAYDVLFYTPPRVACCRGNARHPALSAGQWDGGEMSCRMWDAMRWLRMLQQPFAAFQSFNVFISCGCWGPRMVLVYQNWVEFLNFLNLIPSEPPKKGQKLKILKFPL